MWGGLTGSPAVVLVLVRRGEELKRAEREQDMLLRQESAVRVPNLWVHPDRVSDRGELPGSELCRSAWRRGPAATPITLSPSAGHSDAYTHSPPQVSHIAPTRSRPGRARPSPENACFSTQFQTDI